MNKLEQAARQALEALEYHVEQTRPIQRTAEAITALREALEAAQQPAAPTQDPAAWAITYDSRTPHTLWHEGDGPLLDLEIKRQGGSAQKMALYTTPINLACKSVQKRLAAQWGYVKDDAQTARQPHRTVTYTCPVCAASLERKE